MSDNKYIIEKNIMYEYFEASNGKYGFFSNIENYISNNTINSLSNIDMKLLSDLLGYEAIIGKTSKIYEGVKELHHHDFYEILYIRKGNYIFKVDEKQYQVSSGDVLLITPSALHVLLPKDNIEAERIVLNITPKYIEKLSTPITNLQSVFNKVENSKIYKINFRNERRKKLDSYIDTLLRTQFSKKFGEDILYKVKLSQLLLLINDTYDNIETTDIIVENKIVSKSINYINDNINKPMLIEDIANHLNVSSSTISHAFKVHTGLSVYRYIIKKKMILAKNLIKEGLDFTDIYQLCGFNDYTSFFRCFKKEFNMTPKDFSKANMIFSKD